MFSSLLVVVMMVGGVPMGSPIIVQTTHPDCRNEIKMLEGINKNMNSIGSTVRYNFICNQIPE